MTRYLLDANVAIALVILEHEHHDRASRWLEQVTSFALCPLVEGALVRFVLRVGETAATALSILGGMHEHPRCEFWPDALSYARADLSGVLGYRQVTDSYLVSLAGSREGVLATLDTALALAHPEHTLLLPA